MEFRTRVIAGFAVLAAIAALAIAVQIMAESLCMTDDETPLPILSSEMTFTRSDFLYGPAEYRPYARPLSLNTHTDNPDGRWYLMCVMLNETPQGGNPFLFKVQSVAVDYNFTDLAGTAAFSVYGARPFGGAAWTNRQEGYGSCGYFVQGAADAGEGMPGTVPLKTGNPATVRLANTHGLGPDEIPTGTVTFWFEKDGSGLDALHITTDPAQRKGGVTRDAPETGRFYITHTGGSAVGSVYLLIAVDRPQPETFSLELTTQYAEAA